MNELRLSWLLAAGLIAASAGCGSGDGRGDGTATTASTSAGAASGATTSPEVALPAAPVPDTSVAVAWSVDGTTRLYLCRIRAAACAPVSAADDNARAPSISWSPDGSMVAYGAAELVRIIDATAGSLRTVLPGRSASWSPDGSSLAVVGRAGIELVPSAGGEPRRIASSASADGKGVDDALYDRVLAWSPDGKRLAALLTFYEGSSVAVLSRDGGEPVAETAHWDAVWGDDPNLLYVAAYDKVASYADDGLYLLDLSDVGAKHWRVRLGEAGDGLLRTGDGTLLLGYPEAGPFSAVPEEFRPRGVVAAREARGKGRSAALELTYRRVRMADSRAVPLGLSADDRILLVGRAGAGAVFERLDWLDLASGEQHVVPLPPGEGKVMAAALRPTSTVGSPDDNPMEAAWERGEVLEVRDGELWLPGAPVPTSADVVKELPIPYWRPTSRPAGVETAAPSSDVTAVPATSAGTAVAPPAPTSASAAPFPGTGE